MRRQFSFNVFCSKQFLCSVYGGGFVLVLHIINIFCFILFVYLVCALLLEIEEYYLPTHGHKHRNCFFLKKDGSQSILILCVCEYLFDQRSGVMAYFFAFFSCLFRLFTCRFHYLFAYIIILMFQNLDRWFYRNSSSKTQVDLGTKISHRGHLIVDFGPNF